MVVVVVVVAGWAAYAHPWSTVRLSFQQLWRTRTRSYDKTSAEARQEHLTGEAVSTLRTPCGARGRAGGRTTPARRREFVRVP